MMQTMNSHKFQPLTSAVRLALLCLGASSMLVAALSLLGVISGFFCLVPLTMTFLLLRVLRFQEQAKAKKKAPGRAGRPGA
jgi:hypothetical protein